MTYLLTQIVFSLVLAGVFGAAVGWLANGYRAAGRQDQNNAELMRQNLALSQAETDNKMIEDDFRELKQRSQESIALLKEETRQIPELKNNLEKSQTLVRQLLQKHDAELRNLSAENSVLKNKVRELENREKAVTRLQMDLNAERLKLRSDKISRSKSVTAGDPARQPSSPPAEAGQVPVQPQQIALDADTPRASELPAMRQIDSSDDDIAEDVAEDIFDKADDVLSRFRSDPGVELDAFQMELDQELDAIRHDLASDEIPTLHSAASPDPLSGREQQEANEDSPTAESQQQSAPTADSEQPFHQVFGERFSPPAHSDDLQQIFGIGPVTENTLNSIGIISYEQLALFKREHIEYVADVLQIFPGRIERDNWVDSASKLVAGRSSHAGASDATASRSPDKPDDNIPDRLESEFEDSLEDA